MHSVETGTEEERQLADNPQGSTLPDDFRCHRCRVRPELRGGLYVETHVPRAAPHEQRRLTTELRMYRTRILEQDPDLASGLGVSDRRAAERVCTAPFVSLTRTSSWRTGLRVPAGGGGRLVVVLDGFALQRVTVHGHDGVGIVGPGDVLRVRSERGTVAPTPTKVMSQMSVSVLDMSFLDSAARWPEIGVNIVCRVSDRVDFQTGVIALMHVKQLSARLHRLYWDMAERWGKMTPAGVWLPIRLTQQDLADLVGARRPSISVALSALRESGDVIQDSEGRLIVRAPAEHIELDGAERE